MRQMIFNVVVELKFDSGWGSCRLVSSKKSLRELRDTWAGKVTVSAGEKRKSPSEGM